MRRLLLFILLLLLALPAGCRDLGADRLYALHLDHPPLDADWQRALPREVFVRGGREHKVDAFPDIDSDTVHVTTASCHHGSALPDPVAVDLRAFYTDTDLYLRLSWADPTHDDSFMHWRSDGEAWHNARGLEDGFGIMWDAKRSFADFTCSYACHIKDFGVNSASFHARNTMRLARPGTMTDLWNWKAERTGRYGFADDRFLDTEGMHGDIAGELFRENSVAATRHDAERTPFDEGDKPVYDGEGAPVDGRFFPAGSTVPGYLTDRVSGDRADVHAVSRWENGRWTVILHRRLQTGSAKDVAFVPGESKGIPFGLALMDNTLYEHYASTTQESLVLLPAAAQASGG